jgi:hypothetical protein
MPQLEALMFRGTTVAGDSWSFISHLTKLTRLEVTWDPTVAAPGSMWDSVQQLTNLQSLQLWCGEPTIFDWQQDLNLHPISLLTQLQELFLGVIDTSFTYDLLANLRNLTSLALTWPQAAGTDDQQTQQRQHQAHQQGCHLQHALAGLRHLRHLRLHNIAIPNGLSVAQLSALTYLTAHSTDSTALWFTSWHKTMQLASMRHLSLSDRAATQFLKLSPSLPGVTHLHLRIPLQQGRNQEPHLLEKASSVLHKCHHLQLHKDAGGQQYEPAVEELRSVLATLAGAWAQQPSHQPNNPTSLRTTTGRQLDMSGFHCTRQVMEQLPPRLRLLNME